MDIGTTAYYLNCSELPIWNFYRYGQTKDLRWLAKVEDIEKVNTMPIDCPKLWSDLFNEYCEISDNYESQEHLKQLAEYDELVQKYVVCSMLLENLFTGLDSETEQQYFKELAAWGFAFNQSKLLTESKRASVWLKSIKTKIGMLKSDINTYQSKTTKSERLERQQVKLERISGKNNIDIKTTSVTKWLEIIKDCEETARQKRKKAA